MLGPQPLGIATELPASGVALAQGSSSPSSDGAVAKRSAGSSFAPGGAPIAVDHLAERLVAVAADECVAVLERGDHAPGTDREPLGAGARVDPHDPVGQPREPLHLPADDRAGRPAPIRPR